ncbi:unnamed protein product, partial [Laminaria digitata]
MASTTNVASFRIVSGGTGCDDYKTELTGVVKVPADVSYKGHEVSGRGDGGLPRGLNFIWLCIESNFFDIDSFTMMDASPSRAGGPKPTPAPAPVDTPLEFGDAWQGIPAEVPGIIEAEEFDEGGQGVAYFDTTPGNKKSVFRPNEDVDISALSGGGFNVGFIEAGEFMRYTVDVTKKIDDVFFFFNVASDDGFGSFRVVTGGTGCGDYTTDLSGLVQVPSTGGNVRYEGLEVSGKGTGGLRAKLSHIWFCAESKPFNIDFFSMSKASTFHSAPDPSLSVVFVGDAFDNAPVTVPGTIQAEGFDLGGEGVGYSDTTKGNKKRIFRPNEDVDINGLSENEYVIGFVEPGEYLRYTVDATKK